MINLFKKKNMQKHAKILVNVKKLEELLGGQENIVGAEFSHSKIKILLESVKKARSDEIKNLKGITGIIVSKRYISIIVGNQAKILAKLLVKS